MRKRQSRRRKSTLYTMELPHEVLWHDSPSEDNMTIGLANHRDRIFCFLFLYMVDSSFTQCCSTYCITCCRAVLPDQGQTIHTQFLHIRYNALDASYDLSFNTKLTANLYFYGNHHKGTTYVILLLIYLSESTRPYKLSLIT